VFTPEEAVILTSSSAAIFMSATPGRTAIFIRVFELRDEAERGARPFEIVGQPEFGARERGV
jgi:hypothetical protein